MAKKKANNVVLEEAASTSTRAPRSKVLIFKTATEIGERFGYETPIAVGRKAWLALASKEKLAAVAEEEGV